MYQAKSKTQAKEQAEVKGLKKMKWAISGCTRSV
jgi:hypothetical protein